MGYGSGAWTEHEAYMDKNTWRETEVAKNSDLVEVYDHVIEEFDAFAEHGYVREGRIIVGERK